eukprot:6307547-Pyramimonas_sp.AAC.1
MTIRRCSQLHGVEGDPRRNKLAGYKVLACGGHISQKVKAHQSLDTLPPDSIKFRLASGSDDTTEWPRPPLTLAANPVV